VIDCRIAGGKAPTLRERIGSDVEHAHDDRAAQIERLIGAAQEDRPNGN
jgi:hypothetical protein